MDSDSMACVEVDEAGMRLKRDNGETIDVPEALLQRSGLLRDVLACSDGESASEHRVPISEASFLLWLRQAVAPWNDDHEDNFAQTARLCSLMATSDVLIDEATKMRAAEGMAEALRELDEHGHLTSKIQASLSEDLVLAVFALVPLDHCLICFPRSAMRLALSAHHPSITADRSLTLAPFDSHAVAPALQGIAATTSLVTLSLAGTPPHAALTEFSAMLRALRHLTALDLRDTALSHQPTAAALAQALPAMPRLSCLDLSDNHFNLATMQTLKPALRRCTALRALHMLRTFTVDAPNCNAIARLGAVLSVLGRLTALSIGGRGGMINSGDDGRGALTEPLTRMLCDGWIQLPQLRRLELRFYEADLVGPAAESYDSFLQLLLPQLQHLGLDVPLLWACPLDFVGRPLHLFDSHPPRSYEREAYADLGRAISSQDQLTSLDLDICALRHTRDPTTVIHAAAARLPELLRLQLRFSATNKDRRIQERRKTHDDLLALAAVLPRLTRLSHLHVSAVTRHHMRNDLPRPESLRRVVDAAAGLPLLRVLHLPVPAYSVDDGGLVHAMLALSQLQQLTVDLLLGGRDDMPRGAFLTTLVPLFPHVRSIDVEVSAREDDSWLEPLATDAAALTQLHALHLRGASGPDSGRGLGMVFENISALSSLRDLAIVGNFNLSNTPDLQLDFYKALVQLSGLTALHMSYLPRMESSCDLLFPAFVPYVSCLHALQKLRVPVLASGNNANAYGEQLSRLPLQTLLIDLCYRSDRADRRTTFDLALSTVTRLTQLRVLTFMRDISADDVEAVNLALRQVPTCHYEPYQEFFTQDET